MAAKVKSGRRSGAKSDSRSTAGRSGKSKAASAGRSGAKLKSTTQSRTKAHSSANRRSGSSRRAASTKTKTSSASRSQRQAPRKTPLRGRRTQTGSKAQIMRDHNIIQRWAEERGGKPSMVEDTQILRLNFDEPGGDDDDKLKEVSWEEFFQVFDDSDLTFLYSEQTAEGQTNRFFKFVREG